MIKNRLKSNLIAIAAILVFSIFGVSCNGVEGEEGEVNWYSYQEGIDKMQSEGKTGFLHFYTDWCGYCDKIDKETFSLEKISDFLNEHFIPIKVDADNKQSIARHYGANRFPYNLFLSADNEIIASRPGFISGDHMMDILQYIHTESFKNMSYTEFLDKK